MQERPKSQTENPLRRAWMSAHNNKAVHNVWTLAKHGMRSNAYICRRKPNQAVQPPEAQWKQTQTHSNRHKGSRQWRNIQQDNGTDIIHKHSPTSSSEAASGAITWVCPMIRKWHVPLLPSTTPIEKEQQPNRKREKQCCWCASCQHSHLALFSEMQCKLGEHSCELSTCLRSYVL